MFEASHKAIEPIDTFTTWLLVGTAAVASFLVGNADKLVPIIGSSGFLACGILLCFSCLFGLLSKIFALLGRVGYEAGNTVSQAIPALLAQHDEVEQKIQEHAEALGVEIQSGVRMDRVFREFMAPLPFWARWAVARSLKKHGNNPQAGYLTRIKNLNRQGICAFLQAMTFIAFLLVAFAHAAAT
ncbi:hypothetical protein ACW7GZ_14705 [Luteimonas sp. A537]